MDLTFCRTCSSLRFIVNFMGSGSEWEAELVSFLEGGVEPKVTFEAADGLRSLGALFLVLTITLVSSQGIANADRVPQAFRSDPRATGASTSLPTLADRLAVLGDLSVRAIDAVGGRIVVRTSTGLQVVSVDEELAEGILILGLLEDRVVVGFRVLDREGTQRAWVFGSKDGSPGAVQLLDRKEPPGKLVLRPSPASDEVRPPLAYPTPGPENPKTSAPAPDPEGDGGTP
jgi:hypothetical protein